MTGMLAFSDRPPLETLSLMFHIHGELVRRNLKTGMLPQVPDEPVFDLPAAEGPEA